MAQKPKIYELTLEPPSGDTPARLVRFRELTVEEFERCVEVAGDRNTGWKLTQEGLRMSIVQDGETTLSYTDLVGAKLGERFGTRGLLMLRTAWESVHTPSAEDLERVRAIRVV